MTTRDRTAYPHLNKSFSDKELGGCFSLSLNEREFVKQNAVSEQGAVVLTAMLKTRQYLGYFLKFDQIPNQVIDFICQELGLTSDARPVKDTASEKMAYRHRSVCRQRLESVPFSRNGKACILSQIRKAALSMSDPADLINVAIEQLNAKNIELPAFSTLDRLVSHERHLVHDELYSKVTSELSPQQCQDLDSLLQIQEGEQITVFAQMKQNPGPATLTHFRTWSNRLQLLDAILDPKPFLKSIAFTKIRQFAAEASAHEIGNIRGVSTDARRYTLLLCFLHQAQSTTRDELIEMFLRRMKRVHHLARDKLQKLQEQHRELEESLIEGLGQVLHHAKGCDSYEKLGQQVQHSLDHHGGTEALVKQHELVTAYHHNNYLPLLWPIHARNRTVVFRVLEQLQIKSSTQDDRLLRALEFVQEHRASRKDNLPADINLGFVSRRWQSFVTNKENPQLNRRSFEVCVLSHLAEALQNGDLYVEHSSAYSDYRQQLLPWNQCVKRLPDYCQSLGLPASSSSFVVALKEQLSELALRVDRRFPKNSEFTIDVDGTPHLKRPPTKPIAIGLKNFKKEVDHRMPDRHLLDILNHVHHWSRYNKHFGPPSGSASKMSDTAINYLFTVFGFGCNLGASQTARHAPDKINRQILRRINSQHINASKLEAALNDVIGEYARFELPRFWGNRNVAIADGTHMPLRKNNLMGEQHIRYGGYGGIAYHHISSEYIALFSHFISCGVWEAVYILDALLLNKSVYQPDTLHADTHGQSEPVFGLAHLLGIKLFPRMRTWNDVAFYKPSSKVFYKHIDAMFTKSVDWKLIEIHWKDMMQVVLSIQAGKVLPSMLLRKLNTRNRHNKLYRAFRELGRVMRTLFLLRYISESDFRTTIRAETTKVESYNDFLDWISFGGPVIKSGNPDEQAKQIKYTNLVANSIMLHNVVDLSDVLIDMAKQGHVITKELLASLSPYMRHQIQRFGRYDVDMSEIPPNLNPAPMPLSL